MIRFLVGILGSVVFLDQLTKLLIFHYMPLNTSVPIIRGFFNLAHVRNTGAAFSILANLNPAWRLTFLISLTVVIVGIILYAYSKVGRSDRWTRTAYALICSGAIGNLIDRIRLGEVIDFLDFYVGVYHWPTFNVADIAISTGGVMLLISLIRGK